MTILSSQDSNKLRRNAMQHELRSGGELIWTEVVPSRRVVAWLAPCGILAPLRPRISGTRQDPQTDSLRQPSSAGTFPPCRSRRRAHREKYRTATISERSTFSRSLRQSADTPDCEL